MAWPNDTVHLAPSGVASYTTCPNCARLRRQLEDAREAAAHKGRVEEVGSAVMSRELEAADSTRQRHKEQAHVDSLTMQTELLSAERQLSDAEALTQATLVEARDRSSARTSSLSAASSGSPMARTASAVSHVLPPRRHIGGVRCGGGRKKFG